MELIQNKLFQQWMAHQLTRKCSKVIRIAVFTSSLKDIIFTFHIHVIKKYNPANIYLLKVSNWNIGKRWEICSKLTIEILEQRRWRRFCVSIVNFEHISHLSSNVSIDDFEQVNLCWDMKEKNLSLNSIWPP